MYPILIVSTSALLLSAQCCPNYPLYQVVPSDWHFDMTDSEYAAHIEMANLTWYTILRPYLASQNKVGHQGIILLLTIDWHKAAAGYFGSVLHISDYYMRKFYTFTWRTNWFCTRFMFSWFIIMFLSTHFNWLLSLSSSWFWGCLYSKMFSWAREKGGGGLEKHRG